MRTYTANNVFGVVVAQRHPTLAPLYDEFAVIVASVSGVSAAAYALEYAATLHPEDALYTYNIKSLTNLNVVALSDD